ETLTVLAQVAHALAHIHAAGVLHGDVKPENILITRRDGQPWAKLTDFGLPRITDAQSSPDAYTMGTLAYAAPELLTGRPYGPAGDVYALGVTGYELLSGRRPFDAVRSQSLVQAHLDEQPHRPAGMAKEQWRVIRRCLAKNPRERPTAGQLA